jgi:hypothetical protein
MACGLVRCRCEVWSVPRYIDGVAGLGEEDLAGEQVTGRWHFV